MIGELEAEKQCGAGIAPSFAPRSTWRPHAAGVPDNADEDDLLSEHPLSARAWLRRPSSADFAPLRYVPDLRSAQQAFVERQMRDEAGRHAWAWRGEPLGL